MLTSKQKAFCREYVVDFNGSAAAQRAGYSKGRAKVTASELLTNPEVSAEVSKHIKERVIESDIEVNDVINELKAIAFSKTNDSVKVKDIVIGRGKTRKKIRVVYTELTSDLNETQQKAIAEIKQTKDGISLKNHDKVKALELLGRHLGIFEKDNRQKKTELNLGNLPVTFE